MDDVDVSQYIEVHEGVEDIVDDDEYESSEIFIGKIFDNNDDAYEVYKRYASNKEFDVLKDVLQRYKTSKNIIRRVTKKNLEDETRDEGIDEGKHRETRWGCRARTEIAITQYKLTEQLYYESD